MQAEQGLIQRACLAGLHPLQTGQQHLLEQLRVKIGDGELEQATGDGQRCGMRILACPAVAWRQAVSDLSGQVLDGAPPGHTPGLLVLQQLSHRVELGLGEIDGGAGRCPHQAAQVVRAAKPLEPALGRTGERIRRPVHRHGDGRRAEPGPEQPREHYKRLPASSRAPGAEEEKAQPGTTTPQHASGFSTREKRKGHYHVVGERLKVLVIERILGSRRVYARRSGA